LVSTGRRSASATALRPDRVSGGGDVETGRGAQARAPAARARSSAEARSPPAEVDRLPEAAIGRVVNVGVDNTDFAMETEAA